VTRAATIAEAERIKDALRACETVQQVNACVAEHAQAWREGKKERSRGAATRPGP